MTLVGRSISALRSNYDDLADRVGSLEEADLARPSGASEWDIAAVLSHLGSGAEIMSATLGAAVAGEAPPPDDFNQSVWDRWNAMSRQEQADGFLRTNAELVAAFEALDLDEREELRIKLGFMPKPIDVATLAGMRLNETSLHSWDVQVAFDPAARLSGEEAEIALGQLTGPMSFMVGFIGKPDRVNLEDAVLRVEVTDPTRVLGLALSPKTALGDAPANTIGVLSGPAEAFVRLISGRLAPEHTPTTVKLESDAVTLDDLRKVFPGY